MYDIQSDQSISRHNVRGWPRGHKIRSYDRRLGAAAESADFGVVERKLGDRWLFQTFFIFNLTWGNDPIWLIFFRWVETTN